MWSKLVLQTDFQASSETFLFYSSGISEKINPNDPDHERIIVVIDQNGETEINKKEFIEEKSDNLVTNPTEQQEALFENCGLINNTPEQDKSLPWIVPIMEMNSDCYKFKCNAHLISDQHLLTCKQNINSVDYHPCS